MPPTGYTLVGTSLEYLGFRGLQLASGRAMAVLGECVVGAEVARSLDLGPGGTLVSSPESVFDLARAYLDMGDEDGARPVLMEVIKEGDLAQQAEARELLLRLEAS